MRYLNIFLLILIALPSFAQNQDSEQHYPNAREKINAARAAYITERLSLTSDEAEKFWPVYREYAKNRQDLRRQHREGKRNEHDEKTLLDLELKLKQQELDLEKDYSEKFLKVISPQKLMQLHQAEIDFKRLLIRQIDQRQGGKRQLQRRNP